LETIPLIRPFIGPEEESEVIDTLRSGVIGTGPKTQRFEADFASFVGRQHALGTDSCTNALHMAMVALGIGKGDEVVTTPMTFVATANSVIYSGATPVFVDIRPDTLNVDPERIERAITVRTKAILPVHLYGHPCEMDQIMQIARQRNLKVISDCAHAIEAEYKGRNVGRLGDAACYSFYATKNLATGNGGMMVTDEQEVANTIRIIRDHGMSAGAWARYYSGEFKHYQMTHLGYKCIMWDLQAALGIHQLRRIESRHTARVRIASLYSELLKPLSDHARPLGTASYVKHARHMYPVLLSGVNRDLVASKMHSKGIDVGVHYRPVHLEPFYREQYGHRAGEFPVAEKAGEHLLSLPFWPEMGEETTSRVVEALKDALGESLRHHSVN